MSKDTQNFTRCALFIYKLRRSSEFRRSSFLIIFQNYIYDITLCMTFIIKKVDFAHF
jgi:hypothetical protein